MKEYIIEKAQAGKRLDKWIMSEFPLLSIGLLQKYFRQKDIKINGKHAPKDAQLNEGDQVRLYIPDEYLEKPKKVDTLLEGFRHHLHIIYEDDQLLLVDKQPGIMVHPDDKEKVNTLITHVRAYLYQKGEYDSKDPKAFSPVPCNRIDRFTGGIVMFAKTEAAMRVLNQKIRDREIEKDYLCIIFGQMPSPDGTLDNYILKKEGRRKVMVFRKPVPDAQRAVTRYHTLQTTGDLSLVECELLTGRTHQIRAQFADAGHPLLGDSQYGDFRMNMECQREFQALYAYKLVFRFKGDAGVLNHVNGQTFMVRDVPFVRDYFPEDL